MGLKLYVVKDNIKHTHVTLMIKIQSMYLTLMLCIWTQIITNMKVFNQFKKSNLRNE